MTWWAWLLVGLLVWAALLYGLCLFNYRFWNLVDPRREWRS